MRGKFELPAIKPIDYSLTAGTSIPAPPPSPPASPQIPRPPTPGGGPLSSHPTTPIGIPGSFPLTPPVTNGYESHEPDLARMSTNEPPRTSDTMSAKPSSPVLRKRPSSIRRFLGLGSSNGHMSTDSLAQTPSESSYRPGSIHTAASSRYGGGDSGSPRLTRKKSASWFGRRKSGMFMIGKVDEIVDISEPQQQYQPPSEQRPGPPPPTLPKPKALGLKLDGDDMFRNIK